MSDQPPQSVVVPVEPTPEMTMAGAGCLPSVDGVFGLAGALSANVWSAMLAAAPAPSSLAGGKVLTDDAILAAATAIRESSVAWAKDPDEFEHQIELTPDEIRKLFAALSPEAPARDAGVESDAAMAERFYEQAWVKAGKTPPLAWADLPAERRDAKIEAVGDFRSAVGLGVYDVRHEAPAGKAEYVDAIGALSERTPEAPAPLCDHGHTDPMALCSDCEAASVEAPAEGAGEAARIIACHLPIPEAPDTVYLPITMTAGDLRAIYAALRDRSSAPEARDAAD